MAAQSTTTVKKISVLLIENEESIRFMLQTRLTQAGFSVSVAANGLHGLQKIRSGLTIDIIVCDLKMPGMSGLDLFKEYKKAAGQAPFVLMTGFLHQGQIEEARKLGVREVLFKPVPHAELVQHIQTFVAEARTRSTPTAMAA